MRKSLTLASLTLCLCTSASAQAEFVYTDYLTEGDNLAVTDTSTELTWLNLTVTKGDSYSTTLASIESGELVGWRVATYSEVYAMFDNFFDTIPLESPTNALYDWYYGASYTEIKSFNAFFGSAGASYQYVTAGLILDDGQLRNVGVQVYNGSKGIFYSFSSNNFLPYEQSHASASTWLVLDTAADLSTPVPTPFVFSSLALLGLGLTRRKN